MEVCLFHQPDWKASRVSRTQNKVPSIEGKMSSGLVLFHRVPPNTCKPKLKREKHIKNNLVVSAQSPEMSL